MIIEIKGCTYTKGEGEINELTNTIKHVYLTIKGEFGNNTIKQMTTKQDELLHNKIKAINESINQRMIIADEYASRPPRERDRMRVQLKGCKQNHTPKTYYRKGTLDIGISRYLRTITCYIH